MSPDSPVPKPADFYRGEDYKVADSVGYLIKRVMLSLTQMLDRELADHGLSDAQWKPLLMLAQGRASTVAEMARECGSDPGAMTRLLDRLEAKGLIKRVRSDEDRRVVNLEITAAGRESVAEVPAVLASVANAHLAGFTREEWKTLQGLLRRMADNADLLRGQ
ncbi:MarR family winged helix-turn-helix transcriptional regulator [Methylibium sp.]|uniref:MarR family winged helix-turn-helix transcriptional regulator n=1 Tax=Methylibium sp. TaxID=2067992 RepID=UPI003D0A490D